MSLSNTDMAVADKISAIVFPEANKPPKEAPAAAEQEAPQARAEEDPETDSESQELDTESDTGADAGDVDLPDQDTGHDPDAVQQPSVKAPSGLTADELETFHTLPPAAQKAWARRDQDRAKELSRLQNREAEQKKNYESAMQQIESERQRLAQASTQFGDKAEQEFITKFGDIKTPQDVIALSSTDPMRYLEFDSALKGLQFAAASKQEIVKQQQAREQENVKTFITERNKQLVDHFGDEDAFNKFDTVLSDFLVKEGYSERDITLASAKNLLMADDARKWRQAQSARKTAETKKLDVPPVVRPGAKRDVDVKQANQTALAKKARATGSVDDAAKRISAIL